MKNARAVLFFTAVVLFGMLLGSAVQSREQTAAVKTVRAEEKPIYNSVTASGTVEAERCYAFRTQQNAVVSEVYCKTGDSVQAGQALWRLEPSAELRWTAELLQNALATVSAGGACVTVEPTEGLVRAPEACTLLSVPAVGQSIPSGLTYAQAADLQALRLRVSIAEAFVAAVQAGQHANITIAATGGQYAGCVESVAPVARQAVSLTGTQGAVTVEALVRISGADGSLRPGYSGSAKIFVDEKASAVVLPYEAIRQEGEGEFVYIVGADGRAHRRAITTGYSLSSAVEVLEGVTAGEIAVTEAYGVLEDGMLVEVRA